jgi:phosphoadenosine phosphosulfate reductase
MATQADAVRLGKELEEASASEVIAAVVKLVGAEHVALASSFGAEDQVLTQIIAKKHPGVGLFTLDTGRLPQETYDVMQETMRVYGIRYDVMTPDAVALAKLISAQGPNLFYESVENRKACCGVRKVEPLRRKLSTLKAWICGLRRAQSITRTDIAKVEWDEANGLIKVNPLADWGEKQTWQYIREHGIPYNKLHDKGYPSIGCAPCTRAVEAGEDVRAGRWWWEAPEHKECGLHRKG